MVYLCCVKECPNGRSNTRTDDKLHVFPKNETMAQMWKTRCNVSTQSIKFLRVCCRHFPLSDYVQKQKATLLSEHAVPSLELPLKLKRHYCRVLLPNELKGTSPPCVYEVQINENVSALLSFDATLFEQSGSKKLAGFNLMNDERDGLRDELNYERERNKLLENEMTKLLATQGYLKQNIKNLQTKSKECRRQKLYWKKRHTKRWEQLTELRKRPAVTPISETDGRILAAVGQIFSPSQLRALASKKKRTKWTSDDIAQAISIRSKGSGCYSYMRALGHPFPDKSTICRWTGKLPFVPGLQEEILTMLMHQFLCVPLTSKLAGLCFDETNVDSKLQYDPSLDCILGYCSGMLVVLLRALADDWKQPVYYTFEKNISSEILLSIIIAVEKAGISVRCVTCDMAGGNRGISNDLGICVEKTYFNNPVTQEKVYWFFDPPHLLKLLRNHILDDGIKLSTGGTLRKEDFAKLLNADKSDYKVCYKISHKHIEVEGRERQRVNYATQLLSKSVAVAIEMLFPNKRDVARFIAIINDWFDVFNSRRFDDDARKPFGVDLDNQLRVLNLAYEEISSFRAIGKAMLPFQKGMLIDITSLQGLYLDLSQEPINQKCILTKVVLQDALENCFSIMRSMGEYHDTPNAYEARCRLKNVMLGWNFRQDSTSVSICMEETQPMTFLSTLLLASSRPKPDNNAVIEELEYVGHPEELAEIDDMRKIDETNWEEFYSNLNNIEKCEFGGREYICGFIAKKLNKKFPMMSQGHTDNISREPKSWVQLKSRGGLTVPSYVWLHACKKLDKVFVEHHNVGGPIPINQAPGAKRGLAKKMQTMFPSVPVEAIRLFVRTRCNIRIKHVNQQIVAGRFKRKKKAAQFAKSSMRLRSSGRNGNEVPIVNFINEEVVEESLSLPDACA